MQENNHYKIGLPSRIRFRSEIIFIILIIGFLSFFISGVYAGVKSGRLNEAIVEPLKNFVVELQTEEEYAKPFIEEYPSFNATSSSSVNVEINSQEGIYQTPSDRIYSTPYTYPTIKYKSYEEIKKEQDDWWAKVQEQNRRLSEESKRSLEQFRLDSQRKLENFKKEGQQGLDQFQQESEQRLQEFKQKYGIQ